MSKRKKYHELSPEEKNAKRAKAEALAEKAYKQDIKRSKYFTYIMVFMVLAILVGSFIVPRSKTGKGAYFHVSVPVHDVSLDPQKVSNSWEAGICSLIYEGLVRSKEKLILEQDLEALNFDMKLDEEISRFNVEPALATNWHFNEKENSWVFTLREDIRFHDNNNFTAASVIATFARLLGFDNVNVDTNKEFPIRKLFSAIGRIYKVGDHEVVFELTKPDPFFLQKLALPQAAIISSKHLGRENSAGVNLHEETSGTGPYKLKSKMGNNFIFLLQNESYWGEEGYPGVNIFLLENNREAFNAVDSAELDMALAGSVSITTDALSYNNMSVFKGYSRFFASLVINPEVGGETARLLSNKELRETVLKSVNSREILSENLFELFDKDQLPRDQIKERDPEEVFKTAEKLQTRNVADSSKIELEFTFPLIQTGYLPTLPTLAQAVKNQLADVNIDIKFNILPEETFFKEWLAGNIAFTFANFSDDWFYSVDNFYACANARRQTEINDIFLAIRDIQNVISMHKELSDKFYVKPIGHLLRAHMLDSSVAGKSPAVIPSFFDLLKTVE